MPVSMDCRWLALWLVSEGGPVKRLLVVTNDFGPRAGGIESFVQALIERLPHGTAVILTSHQAGSQDFDRDFSSRTGALIIRDRSRVLLPTPRVTRKAKELLSEHQIDRVWFGAAAPLALMAQSLRRSGASIIVATTHGHEVWWAQVPVMKWAIRKIGNSVDWLTYLGDYTATKLSRALSTAGQQRLTRLTPGVDIEHFRPVAAHPIRAQISGPVLVCVSRLVHRKGQDRLIAALPIIRRTIPTASLLLVGTGPLLDKLRQLAIKEGVADAVHFTGRVPYEDLPSYFCAGDLFVMPTRDRLAGLEVEGLGMVYLEANACGLAVLAGRSGGSPDAVLDHQTGLIVNDDVEELAARCVELLSNPERLEQMGQAGRRWVQESWQWSTIAAEHQRLLVL